MVRGLPAVLIEAFSEKPLGGNGAAVVHLQYPAPASWMQLVAGRLQQSETSFLLPHGKGWGLRWFTPCREVPLCGHATLAAILALSHWRRLPVDGATTFFTRSGPLNVCRPPSPASAATHLPNLAQLDLPQLPMEQGQPPPDLAALLSQRLGLQPVAFWTSGLGYQVVLLSPDAPLERIESPADLLTGEARNGLVLMQPLPPGSTKNKTVAGDPADYQLRFFAPDLGIDEDSVTGSAHALVAPFWMDHLQRDRVVGWQCSDRPGGMVCEVSSSAMIRLTGSGHLLWEGTFWAEPELSSAERDPSMEWQLACGL